MSYLGAEIMDCPKCGTEMRMHVQVIISAPSSMEGNFSKRNIRKKEVYLLGVKWETADYICKSCGTIIPDCGNYVCELENKIQKLEKQLKGDK